MNNTTLLVIILTLFTFVGCNKGEDNLLKPKIYFDKEEVVFEVDETEKYDYDLVSRVSTPVKNDLNVEYQIEDESLIKEYNQIHGTKYKFLSPKNFILENNKATIKSGDIYSNSCKLTLKNLGEIKEGNTFLIPIRIKNANAPLINASSIIFVVVKKPIIIRKVYDFNGNYLSVPMPSTANFKAITYEALIYADNFRWIRTILGREGVLMFRFGDTNIKVDQIQIAGAIQFNAIPNFQTKKWYHVAFVFDSSTKKAEIYINGEKSADKTVDVSSLDLTKDFFIGYAYDYDSRRIWEGKMSECRIWNVARTANQIKNNMMAVDPQSEGLFGYWKLNGSDYYEKDGKYYVKDQSKNKIDAVSRIGAFQGGSGRSVKPNVVNLKVDLK